MLVLCGAEELEMASIGTRGLSITSVLSLHCRVDRELRVGQNPAIDRARGIL